MTKTEALQETIRGNIRRLREQSGKTKTDLCNGISMSRKFWDDVENGVKEGSVSTLERIASALGVSIQDLLEPPKKRDKRELTGVARK